MSREEQRRDREEANRKIDELDASFPSTVDPKAYPGQPLPQPAPKNRPATPPAPDWLNQLAEAKEIFRACDHKEDEDRLADWIAKFAETASQGKAAMLDTDSGLLDIDNTDEAGMVDIAERRMEKAVREMKTQKDDRWKELQKRIDTYFHEKNKRAGSPAMGV